MVLTASDELRHASNDDFHWRESLYFNLADPDNEIGVWLYLWVLPNQEKKTGMLAAFYHGVHERFDILKLAQESPGHRIVESDGRWAYCVTQEFPDLVDADFDDISVGGLTLKRLDPLKTYAISYADDAGNTLSLDAEFLTIPWDYADGVFPAQDWVAANRYHRSWRAQGSLQLGSDSYRIDSTGDSDHSWGKRDGGEFTKNYFKMWSLQTPEGSHSLSAVEIGESDAEVPMGFVDIAGDTNGVASIDEHGLYTPTGVQHDVTVSVTDAVGRNVNAHLDSMFAAIGSGAEGAYWGYEGVGFYDVEDWGRCSGIVSYFWPGAVTPQTLSAT